MANVPFGSRGGAFGMLSGAAASGRGAPSGSVGAASLLEASMNTADRTAPSATSAGM
ncbi:hypothetical protein WBQ80_07155 [Agromyces sp. CCNWLW213]